MCIDIDRYRCIYIYIYIYVYIYMYIYIYIYIYIYNRVKKNSKIRLEVSCYSFNHQVFRFYLVLKIIKIHIKLTKVQKYFSASLLNILSIHAIISF